MKYAILIDAGFMKRKLGSRTRPFDIQGVTEFIATVRAHAALATMQLYRIYWYDAPPLTITVTRPLSGGRVNFGTTPLARSSAELLEALRVLPFISIRRGELAFRGWKVRQGRLPPDAPRVSLSAADIEPNVHQKGVDMRLGLDIAALSLKAHVGAIVLVAGDSDFVPAMKFARREGVQILLVTFGHPVRPGMREHSDLLLDVPRASPPITTTAADAA